jgi:hypothetical protein
MTLDDNDTWPVPAAVPATECALRIGPVGAFCVPCVSTLAMMLTLRFFHRTPPD